MAIRISGSVDLYLESCKPVVEEEFGERMLVWKRQALSD